jgi:hypothetical protein
MPSILHGTFAHARRRYRFRFYRSEARYAKFVRFILITPFTLPLWHRVLACGEGKAVDMRHQISEGRLITQSRIRMRLSEVCPIWPRPNMPLQPSHHAYDIGARFVETVWIHGADGATCVPK